MSDQLDGPITSELIRDELLPSLRRTIVPLISLVIYTFIGGEILSEGVIAAIVGPLLAIAQYGVIRWFEIKAGGAVKASILIGGKGTPSYSTFTAPSTFKNLSE